MAYERTGIGALTTYTPPARQPTTQSKAKAASGISASTASSQYGKTAPPPQAQLQMQSTVFSSTPPPAAGGVLATQSVQVQVQTSAPDSDASEPAPVAQAKQVVVSVAKKPTAAKQQTLQQKIDACRRSLASASLEQLVGRKALLGARAKEAQARAALADVMKSSADKDVRMGTLRIQALRSDLAGIVKLRVAAFQRVGKADKSVSDLKKALAVLMAAIPAPPAADHVAVQMETNVKAEEATVKADEAKVDTAVADADAKAADAGLPTSGQDAAAGADGPPGMPMGMIAAGAIVGGFVLWKLLKG